MPGLDDAAEVIDFAKDHTLLNQSFDSEDDAADMLPRVTFRNMDRDYLTDRRRREDKALSEV